jgi:alkylhydroperoxidase family enzyme
MSDPRVPLLSADSAAAIAAAAGVPAERLRLNIFRCQLRHPSFAFAMHTMLRTLGPEASLDRRLRELAIMRTAWVAGSEYEWAQHWNGARTYGVSAEDLVGVRDWRMYPFEPAARAILAATDDVLETWTISDSSWELLSEHIGSSPETLIEIVATIACWCMGAIVLNGLQVPLEDGVAPWPPDGTAPKIRQSESRK